MIKIHEFIWLLKTTRNDVRISTTNHACQLAFLNSHENTNNLCLMIHLLVTFISVTILHYRIKAAFAARIIQA